ncbi:hypothetical protein BDV11DRAFT_215620 [Aspergillus similis]
MPSHKLITTACDACRRRKVKCDGLQPCGRCQDAEIPCRTTSVRRKKGRQGATATVLHELRKAPAPTTQVQSVLSPQSTAISDPFIRQPGLLNPSVVQSCADYFFPRMLGTVPILPPTTFQDHVARVEDSLHSYCLVAAFCAFVFAQTGYVSWLSPGNPTASLGRLLLDEAMAARCHLDPFSESTRHGIIIAFLLYGCQIGLGNQRQAYYFLREATTLYTAGMLDPAEVDGEDAGYIFWLLLISERHRPITLQITRDSPVLRDTRSDAFSLGFRCLAELYRPFDQRFLSRWNGTDSSATTEQIIQLEEHLQQAVPADVELPDIILADLRVSQQRWLSVEHAVASVSGLRLSTTDRTRPVAGEVETIERELGNARRRLGINQAEKVFEITCTLTDVMACMTSARLRSSNFDLGPQDYLKHLCTLIQSLPGGKTKFLPLLLAKISQTLPSMLGPVARHLSLPSCMAEPVSVSPNVDIGSPVGHRDGWSKGLNWAKMSHIGDRTPESGRGA